MASSPQTNPDLVDVFVTQQESEAMVVHGLLESGGIESAVITEEAQDVLPFGSIVIRVSPEEADEARRIIEEYKNTALTEDEDIDDQNSEDQSQL
jgi:hypothetical protein